MVLDPKVTLLDKAHYKVLSTVSCTGNKKGEGSFLCCTMCPGGLITEFMDTQVCFSLVNLVALLVPDLRKATTVSNSIFFPQVKRVSYQTYYTSKKYTGSLYMALYELERVS